MGRQGYSTFLTMSTTSRHLVVATAGHIDHGKTALVRALSGMETDRLEEEKRRGITIELGFAFLGDDITIIDVPGHERFIKTMVAGVTTVDLALLVVAADDGVMPQTREHLAIVYMLGVPNLFVVVTKISNLEQGWLDMVEDDIRLILPSVYRSSTRFFRCDSITGQGIPELKAALLSYAEAFRPRPMGGVFRLPLDRAFSLKGHGTIVTGTVLSGEVKAGDRLQVMPSGVEVRVRGVQSHGRNVKGLGAGERAALNVTGADVERISRGQWLCARDSFLATEMIDAKLEMLADVPPLKNRDRVRLHIGTSETMGRVVVFGGDVIPPGAGAFVQINLEERIMAVRGDRFILRRYSPLQTLGGGWVIDPIPERKQRTDPHALRTFEILERASGLEALLEKVNGSSRHGLSTVAARTFMNVSLPDLNEGICQLQDQNAILLMGTLDSGYLVAPEVVQEARAEALTKIDDFHRKFPQLLGLPQASLVSELSPEYPVQVIECAINELLEEDITLDGGYVRRRNHEIRLDSALAAQSDRIEELLDRHGFKPPALDEIRKQLGLTEPELNRVLSVMVQQGRIVRMADGSPWSSKQVRTAWEMLKKEFSGDGGKTMSELREILGCPRRYAISLIEYFDNIGLTERREDVRVPGPRFTESVFVKVLKKT